MTAESNDGRPHWYIEDLDAEDAGNAPQSSTQEAHEAFEREHADRWSTRKQPEHRMRIAHERIELLARRDTEAALAAYRLARNGTILPVEPILKKLKAAGMVYPGTSMLKASEKRALLERYNPHKLLDFAQSHAQ